MEKDSTEDKLDKVDSYLTKFGIIMKKHWGKLLFLGLCWIVYWIFTQPPVEAPEPTPDYVAEPAPEEYLGNPAVVEQMQEYGEDTTPVEDSIY